MIRSRPTLSIAPLVLPAAEAQAWPAIGPCFSLTGGAPRYAPAEKATVAAEKRSAARLGSQGLEQVAAVRARGALPSWQCDLAEAAGLLKCSELTPALVLLQGLTGDVQLQRSLLRTALGAQGELVAAHWLWLVAHVAVENGHGLAVLPQLLPLGLASRASDEPRLAAALVVNAMQQGQLELLTFLREAGFELSHQREAHLKRHTQTALDEFFGPDKKYVRRHPHKCATLAWLRQAYDALGLSTDLFAAYDAHQKKQDAASASPGPLRRMLCTGRALSLPSRGTNDEARRTTGVALRVTGTSRRQTELERPTRTNFADLEQALLP